MHRGHFALLERARASMPHTAVVTFEPHPTAVLAPERAPARLQTPMQRQRWCESMGVDALAVLPFTRALADLSPQDFAVQFVVQGLAPRVLVVGADFRFGKKRVGTPTILRELLAPHDIRVEIVDACTQRTTVAGATHETDEKISSTWIRSCLVQGDVEMAGNLLGRWHAVSGEVVHGDGRGHGLGFPTANLAAHNLLPKPGVYAGYLRTHADLVQPGQAIAAVANIGKNPTFAGDDAPIRLEAHVLDQAPDFELYGQKVEFALVARLRDEMRFDSIEALRQAIANDIRRARACLNAEALANLEAHTPT